MYRSPPQAVHMLVQKLAVLLADKILKPVCELLNPFGDGAGDFEPYLFRNLFL